MRWTGKNKYHAKKVTIDGIEFASKKEGMRYIKLREMMERGEISDLRMQVPFELVPAVLREETIHLKTKDKTVTRMAQRAISYVADFVYEKDGKTIVEDTKGFRTEGYKLKKKMMYALKGIEIQEI